VRTATVFIILAVLLNTVEVCFGDEVSELALENDKLRHRVEKLEKELAELKKIVMQQGNASKVEEKAVTTVKVEEQRSVRPELSEYDVEKIVEKVQKEYTKKESTLSALDIELYGYIKADAAYDTSHTTTGNYALWVDSDVENKDDDEFNMTANQTRLGLRIAGPRDGEMETSGVVEVDFYGSGAPENKAKIQMRHAYMKLDWPEENFNIIAGQTSDVISPLNPSTLNYTVLWNAGNIGYRRPQIRLTKSFPVNSDVALTLEGALARNIGRENDLTPATDSGEDSGVPAIQGRTSLSFPFFGYKPTTLGVSGHWSEEEYDTSAIGSDTKFKSWSVGLDLTQPVNRWLTIKGELFTGRNLDTYLGGIGQGVNTNEAKSIYYKEIPSTGGWVAASLGPWDRWRFNVGMGMDDVDSDYVNTDDRILNRSVFGNFVYSFSKSTEVGFELSQWHTERKGQGNADNLRAQMSFLYKF